jgi:hypothetical protein
MVSDLAQFIEEPDARIIPTRGTRKRMLVRFQAVIFDGTIIAVSSTLLASTFMNLQTISWFRMWVHIRVLRFRNNISSS